MITLPAGKYWVGDPCYVVPNHDDWIKLLESCGYFDDESPIGTLPNGVQVIAFGTMHGDGEYLDQEGNSYPVDAGLIGIVSAEYVEGLGDDHSAELGHMHTFTREFRCDEDDGVITFGYVQINTDWEEDEHEY